MKSKSEKISLPKKATKKKVSLKQSIAPQKKLQKATSLAKKMLTSKRRTIDFYARTHFKDSLVDRCEEISREIYNRRMLEFIDCVVFENTALANKIRSFNHEDSELEILIRKLTSDSKLLKENYSTPQKKTNQKAGRTRTDKEICEILLSAIHFCEVNKLDPIWIKEFMMPKDRLYHAIEVLFGRMEVPLPVPSDGPNDKTWLYKLKETLQRNLFTSEGNKVKKKYDDDFYQIKEKFYLKLERENSDLLSHFRELQTDLRFQPEWDWEPEFFDEEE